MIQQRLDKGLKTEWETPEEVMEWWLTGKIEKQIAGQMEIDINAFG